MTTAQHAMVQVSPDEWTEPVEKALARALELKIQFLAIDFDCTILDIHTGGNHKGTLDELIPHVRPMFVALLQKALESKQMQVGIVTFSGQVDLIRALLERVLGRELADQIVIRGGNGRGPVMNGNQSTTWAYHGTGARGGKQTHMASAVEELEAIHKVQLTKATTLLIDDDVKNVKIALHEGVRAIWLNPNKSYRLLKDMAELV